VEHVASLRAIPNLLVMRPGDGTETSGAYKVAVSETKRPPIVKVLPMSFSSVRVASCISAIKRLRC